MIAVSLRLKPTPQIGNLLLDESLSQHWPKLEGANCWNKGMNMVAHEM